VAANTINGEPSSIPSPQESRQHDATLGTLFRSPRIRIAVANYGLLALLEIAHGALQPVFFASPVALGGLALPPQTIGALMGAYGFANGCVQATFFRRYVKRFGLRRCFINGMSGFVGIWAVFAGANWVAWKLDVGSQGDKKGSLPVVVWAIIGMHCILFINMQVCFGRFNWKLRLYLCFDDIFVAGSIFIYVASAAPDKRSLGATNGISQQLGKRLLLYYLKAS
jgi:hypothetical protein